MKKPRISIVISTFNGEEYIEEQLHSIFSQTVIHDEIIINDDGSKDDTISVIRKYLKNQQIGASACSHAEENTLSETLKKVMN